MCGGPGMDLKVSSTIGFERAHNAPLAIATRTRSSTGDRAARRRSRRTSSAIVALNRGPLRTRRRDVHAADAAPGRRSAGGGRAGRRRAHRRAVRRRARPGRRLHHRAARRLRLQARVDRRPRPGRSSSSAATTPTRCRGASSRRGRRSRTSAASWRAGMTSWREERRPVERVERIDVAELHERARRRLQSSTCASGPSGTRATSPARSTCPTTTSTAPGRARPGPADRRDLRLGPAQRGRREPAPARTARATCIHVVDGGVGTWAAAGWPLER